MHKWAEEIAETLKAKVESIGIENFEGQNLDDLKDWTEIIKNICDFDYHYKIIEAMDKSEYGKDYDENGELLSRSTAR